MFCHYLPQPPRAWSRVQHACSLIDTVDENLLPQLGAADMSRKGNVLQYKANSSQLTQNQRYSKIAQGKWTNRTVTWATQSARGYTNPNTTSLKRSGNVIRVALDPFTGAILGPTLDPVTCPGAGVPQSSPIVIQDGGVLLCSVQENVCTGETKHTLSQQLCHPASDSDVPGQEELCWNDGRPTWFPKQQTTMSNSTNKWPYNYKGLTSAVRPLPPTLLSASLEEGTRLVTLKWSMPAQALPLSALHVFQNDALLTTLAANSDTIVTVLANAAAAPWRFSMTAVTNGSRIESWLSNTVLASTSA